MLTTLSMTRIGGNHQDRQHRSNNVEPWRMVTLHLYCMSMGWSSRCCPLSSLLPLTRGRQQMKALQIAGCPRRHHGIRLGVELREAKKKGRKKNKKKKTLHNNNNRFRDFKGLRIFSPWEPGNSERTGGFGGEGEKMRKRVI